MKEGECKELVRDALRGLADMVIIHIWVKFWWSLLMNTDILTDIQEF